MNKQELKQQLYNNWWPIIAGGITGLVIMLLLIKNGYF